ncbi:MAG: HutD family protein, partial [Microbacterium sp.]|nr:HutD family protein [Microbacterium sp.]
VTAVEVIRFASRESRPWANGGGSTRVLIDDATTDGAWTYRISVAELVGMQPFSRFPGVDRHLTFLGPGTLALSIDGVRSALAPFDEVVFRGEDEVVSTPSDPSARDLNVMVRRDQRGLRAARLSGARTLTPSPDAVATVWISLAAGGVVGGRALQELDVALLPGGRPSPVSGRGLLAEVLPTVPGAG